MSVTIASWNVNSLRVRQAQVLDYLTVQKPDVLCLQEIKQEDSAVNTQAFLDAGWFIVTHGQKTYNGVALISKERLTHVTTGIPSFNDAQSRVISGCINDICIVNVYVPNGKQIGDEKYSYKLNWLAALSNYISTLLNDYPKLVLIGDFNIAPADIDVHNPDQWRDKILCSIPERTALNTLLAHGFTDAFRHCHPNTQTFSWWDYRANGWKRNIGLRIDLSLAATALTIHAANISIEQRELERPSDHAPIWLQVS